MVRTCLFLLFRWTKQMMDHLNCNRSFELIWLERFSIPVQHTAHTHTHTQPNDQKGKRFAISSMWFVYSCESRNVVANNAIICRFIKCKSVAQELRLQCGGCCCYCCCCFVFTSCHKFVTSHLFVVWTVKSVQNVRFMVNSQHYHVCLSVFLLNQK